MALIMVFCITGIFAAKQLMGSAVTVGFLEMFYALKLNGVLFNGSHLFFGRRKKKIK